MRRGSVPSVNSYADHKFSMAPQASIPRSKFNRSHGVKTTFDAGFLYPVLVDEMLPGDTFNLKMQAFARMATLINPVMDNMYFETFFFSVPYRLVWDNWEKFNGFQENPGDSTAYLVPIITAPAVTGIPEGSIYDYMGLPTQVPDIYFDSLHLRAYNLIWNEWFRDENLQDSVVVHKGDVADPFADYTLLRRGKRHDYFTSCLPFPQKGPDVELPLGSVAPVITNNQPMYMYTVTDPAERLVFGIAGSNNLQLNAPALAASGNARWGVTGTGLQADLSAATAATINDLRLAFQTQKLYERDARGGTRYTEVIKSHFGVQSPDSRLQRPEYLGGGQTPILVNPVAQTATNVGGATLGDLGAYAVCAPHGHGFTYSATEHCLILGLVSVRADLNYQQGIERMWSRQSRLDFYWPALSHIGEQAVLNKEIFASGAVVVDEAVFGYQERYAEYRYKPSLVTGQFRSNAAASLDSWHLAQDFAALPLLNEVFIQENPPIDRIVAVPVGQPQFKLDAFFTYMCARPMPVYAVPGLVDHF